MEDVEFVWFLMWWGGFMDFVDICVYDLWGLLRILL